MTELVDVRIDHRHVIQNILLEHLPDDVKVWVFGSRSRWVTKDFSDLDLALKGDTKLDWKLLVRLSEAFNDSDLPYAVDIVDLNAVSDRFRVIVESQMTRFPLDHSVDTGDWRWMSLHDAAEINPYVPLDLGGEYSFVNMASVTPGVKFISASTVRSFKGSGSKFRSGDTLMARITPCLENGKIAQYRTADGADDRGHGSTEFIVIRGRRNVTDSDFIYYLIRAPSVQHYAISQMHGTSGRQRVPVSALKSLRIRIPPLCEQHKIASVLGGLDEKIELNRRMSKTLEEMARALFKSWFVDFDPVRAKMDGHWRPGESLPGLPTHLYDLFPDHLVPSEMGEIPDGWQVGNLEDVIEVNPRRNIERGGMAVHVAMDALPTSGPHIAEWTHRSFTSGSRFTRGDTLLARITPSLENGKTAFVDFLDEGETGWGSTEFIVLRPKHPWPPMFAYLLARQPRFRRHAIVNMTGTSGRQRVPAKAIASYALAVPAQSVAVAFGKIVQAWFDLTTCINRQSRTLASSRDVLLPRLVTGKMEVNIR